MNCSKKLSLAILSAAFASNIVFANPEFSGKVVHESASFTSKGTSTGTTTEHDQDAFKEETSVRLYVDGGFDDAAGSTYHVELQGYENGVAVHGLGSYDTYTQRDLLREAYIDTTAGDWNIRAGKQQVVWGTADGAKFLDMINPTDYTEMAQNQMEDSRIPVWMLNSAKTLEDGGEFQLIISQPRENVFSGLNRNISTDVRSNTDISGAGPAALSYSGDTISPGHNKGNPFILKGVDTISGEKNGFLNIVPDIGTIATLFGRAFDTYGTSTKSGMSNQAHDNYAMSYFTVGGFNNSAVKLNQFSGSYDTNFSIGSKGFGELNFGGTDFWNTDANGCNNRLGVSVINGSACTYESGTAGGFYSGQQALSGFAGMFGTSAELQNTDSATNSVFELMDRTPFATFDAFVDAKSQYVLDMPSDSETDYSMRYKNSLADGSNYTFNYSFAYDKNPVIDLNWYDSSGNKLNVIRNDMTGTLSDGRSAPGGYTVYDTSGNPQYQTAVLTLAGGSVSGGYGGYNITNNSGEGATLRFTQSLRRAHNIGGSFDTTIETDGLGPIVLRAEGLYSKDVYQPVIDRGALAIGDLTAALTMRKGDRFKYVIGADVTALTNMMVSVQFIQDRNLDFIDTDVDFDGTPCSANRTNTMNAANCGVYTLDFAGMHLSNGLKKAEKNKEFVSVYLSKPFGESGQHRWNNITMIEDAGGRWNRLDVEYTLNDNTVATAEYNRYWGDPSSQFGQLEDSSNVQLGVKYSF